MTLLRWISIYISILFIIETLSGCAMPPQGIHELGSADPLSLELVVDKSDCLQRGDIINVQFSAKNKLSQTYSIDSKDKPTLDIRITRLNNLLAQWSMEYPEKAAHQLEWQPGESKTIEMTFTVPQAKFAPGEKLNVVGWVHHPSSIAGHPDSSTVLASLCLGSRSH